MTNQCLMDLFIHRVMFNTEADLSECVCYLNSDRSRILASNLKFWSLLDMNTKISSFHKHQEEFLYFVGRSLNNSAVV
jgi:hypothetical protein